MRVDGGAFIGSAVLTSGVLNRHQLRTRYRAVFPDVYLSEGSTPSLHDRVATAWLWSRGRGTIAGLSAAAVHGSRWIPDDAPVELIHSNPRPPAGIVMRRVQLRSEEVQLVDGRPVTTPARTAFDLGRRDGLAEGVARLDALCRATGLDVDAVVAVAARHPGARGLRTLETALELVDRGAESPKETHLRLALIRGGLPRPQTQVPVHGDDGTPVAYLDLGWPEWLVGVEYDGDQHRTDRRQYIGDIRRRERVEQLGWLVVRVVAEDQPADVLRRVRRAIDTRRSAGSQSWASSH